jgi:hypothetical protein
MATLHKHLNFMYKIKNGSPMYNKVLKNECLFVVVENLCLIQIFIKTWPLKKNWHA